MNRLEEFNSIVSIISSAKKDEINANLQLKIQSKPSQLLILATKISSIIVECDSLVERMSKL